LATQRADYEKLNELRREISRDAGELRQRWQQTRSTFQRGAVEVGSVGREVWQLLWLTLRRRTQS
jgi:hypothetical protein